MNQYKSDGTLKRGTIVHWRAKDVNGELNTERDVLFCELMEQLEGHTAVDASRCYILYQFAKYALEIAGNVAEVGVHRGGTTKLLSRVFIGTKKMVHAFDTFEGFPPTDPVIDVYGDRVLTEGLMKADYDTTMAYLSDCDNVRVYKGIFPQTSDPIETQVFCFVHIDCDIYPSVRDCCQFFYPRLNRGGIMIFDDYGFYCCPGAKKAVDEYFNDKPEHLVYLPGGQAMVIKL